jgi:hypothetical protein
MTVINVIAYDFFAENVEKLKKLGIGGHTFAYRLLKAHGNCGLNDENVQVGSSIYKT